MKKKIFIIERTNIYVNNMIYFDAIFSFRRSNDEKPTPSLPPSLLSFAQTRGKGLIPRNRSGIIVHVVPICKMQFTCYVMQHRFYVPNLDL